MGRPGQAYTLWSDSAGFVLNATLSAGGADGKAIFISSIQLVKLGASPGSSTAALRRAGTQWQLSGAGRWAAAAGRRGWWQADGEGAPACRCLCWRSKRAPLSAFRSTDCCRSPSACRSFGQRHARRPAGQRSRREQHHCAGALGKGAGQARQRLCKQIRLAQLSRRRVACLPHSHDAAHPLAPPARRPRPRKRARRPASR